MTRPVQAPPLLRLWLGVALIVAGCASVTPDPTPTLVASAGPRASVAAVPTVPTASPHPIEPSSSPPSAETHPPPATLVDAGGREVNSQIGTFVWQGVVSDSPLLPGAPVTVRTGQGLTISVIGPWNEGRVEEILDPVAPDGGRAHDVDVDAVARAVHPAVGDEGPVGVERAHRPAGVEPQAVHVHEARAEVQPQHLELDALLDEPHHAGNELHFVRDEREQHAHRESALQHQHRAETDETDSPCRGDDLHRVGINRRFHEEPPLELVAMADLMTHDQ